MGSVLTRAGATGVEETCCSGLAGLGQCTRPTEEPQLTGKLDDDIVIEGDCDDNAGEVALLLPPG